MSKQFTAAAVLLLAREGKLSLDDPVRKYIPELPDYGTPLTIRHMLNHTSGLRDWGSVAGIAGWPRTTRVYTHAHVLDIVHHQQSLNFPPGTHWSYSNTGFNLAAIIVSRVSGMSFRGIHAGAAVPAARHDAHLLARRLHAHRQGPRGRVRRERDEGVPHGHAVRERLRQRRAADDGRRSAEVERELRRRAEGDAALIVEQQQAGRFNDGRTHGYALGLFVGKYKGVREVYHSGSTAGYQRVPDAISRSAPLRRRAVQRDLRPGDAVRACGGRFLRSLA